MIIQYDDYGCIFLNKQKDKITDLKHHADSKLTDTAVYFVRLRETSAVCMRLKEEEAEDGTPLMLMRELSVSGKSTSKHRLTRD